eukprot:SAG31_NODE_31288_length_370_cov_0.523985_1_plen_57_part_10
MAKCMYLGSHTVRSCTAVLVGNTNRIAHRILNLVGSEVVVYTPGYRVRPYLNLGTGT